MIIVKDKMTDAIIWAGPEKYVRVGDKGTVQIATPNGSVAYVNRSLLIERSTAWSRFVNKLWRKICDWFWTWQ